MRFIIEYGCDGIGSEFLAIEAKSLESATHYAYLSAFDYREGYEGLHGVLTFAEFCEGNDLDENDESSWEDYSAMVEDEIFYGAEDFNKENDIHLDILAESGGVFFQI